MFHLIATNKDLVYAQNVDKTLRLLLNDHVNSGQWLVAFQNNTARHWRHANKSGTGWIARYHAPACHWHHANADSDVVESIPPNVEAVGNCHFGDSDIGIKVQLQPWVVFWMRSEKGFQIVNCGIGGIFFTVVISE